MVEQLKSLDYAQRGATFIEGADPAFLEQVLDLIDSCVR